LNLIEAKDDDNDDDDDDDDTDNGGGGDNCSYDIQMSSSQIAPSHSTEWEHIQNITRILQYHFHSIPSVR